MLLVGLCFVVPLICAVVLFSSRFRKSASPDVAHENETPGLGNKIKSEDYGTSPSCQTCHPEEFAKWSKSHHALAERHISATNDATAFRPARRIQHASQSSEASLDDGKFHLNTTGPYGTNQTFDVARVIGVYPLTQYLISIGGGRVQATELCFDPERQEWFNVYGDEDRQAGEWGHWTGRGMNWNSMCASCHNTWLQKNYDPGTDGYVPTMVEMGVGCEACHGAMSDHNAWQAGHPNRPGDPTIKRFKRQQVFETCAQCHSRRAELTGQFQPGDSFLDHHQLTIPDDTELYYADGQVREEDYEYSAFLGSKMHAAGVRCVECHDSHTSKVRLPGNLMCMSCHGALTNGAPRIDLTMHSRHRIGERGDFCTDCHMPQTLYMQRHPRHDHGFTIPDPRLTKRFGIPNACNRCHVEQSSDWALDAIVKWYGPRTNDSVLARTGTIFGARNGDRAAVPGLRRMLQTETNFYWRAVAANLLKPWSDDAEVASDLLTALADTNALVRGMAVRGLDAAVRVGDGRALAGLRSRLEDVSRTVRVDAAWALRSELDTNSTAGRDLMEFMAHTSDQPGGLFQAGVFKFDRGDLSGAISLFERAIKWDSNSAPIWEALGTAQSRRGSATDAVDSLRMATQLSPHMAEYQFKLGLALNETGQLVEAAAALTQATRLEPRHARAWYNLGLAQSLLNQPEFAIESLLRAEALDSRSPIIPYARATILVRIGRLADARTAAARALELDPDFTDARQLLATLGR